MRRWLVVSAIAAVIVVPGAVAQGQPGSDEPPSTVVVEVSDSFHWKDAGVGAVAAVALVTIAIGVALVVRDRPETPPATWEGDT